MNRRTPTSTTTTREPGFVRGLNLFDATMVVTGSMIGSGIFIVTADMSRLIGSPGWMLVAWAVTGLLTIAAALSYGELASMLPHAGRHVCVPARSVLAVVGVPVWLDAVHRNSDGHHRGRGGGVRAIHGGGVSASLREPLPGGADSHFVAVRFLTLHRATGGRGRDCAADVGQFARSQYGKMVQNLFTTAKTAALAALILAGLLLGWSASAVKVNFTGLFKLGAYDPALGVAAGSAFGLMVALCVAQSGSMFAADAWHDITFAAGEVRNPRRNLPLRWPWGVRR